MKEFVEKLIERLEEELYLADKDKKEANVLQFDRAVGYGNGIAVALEIVNQLAEEFDSDINVGSKNKDLTKNNQGWIPCSERLPEPEKEVLIMANRKYTGGKIIPIITTAIYEDGTILENDSIWNWTDIDGEWNEEEDCYIIPQGWFEYRHYNPDEVYNNAVDDKVIAWQPLPEPYKEQQKEIPTDHYMERFIRIV